MSLENLSLHYYLKQIKTVHKEQLDKLTNEIELLKKAKENIVKKYPYSLSTQILIAHYSEMFNEKEMSNGEKAMVLQKQFEVKGSERLRQMFSKDINKLKTIKNLQKAREYLEREGNQNGLHKCLVDLEKATGSSK